MATKTLHAFLVRHERHTNNIVAPEDLDKAAQTGERLGRYIENILHSQHFTIAQIGSPQPRARDTVEAMVQNSGTSQFGSYVSSDAFGDITNGIRPLDPLERTRLMELAKALDWSPEKVLCEHAAFRSIITTRAVEVAAAFKATMMTVGAVHNLNAVAVFGGHGGRWEPMLKMLTTSDLPPEMPFYIKLGGVVHIECIADPDKGTLKITEIKNLGDLSAHTEENPFLGDST